MAGEILNETELTRDRSRKVKKGTDVEDLQFPPPQRFWSEIARLVKTSSYSVIHRSPFDSLNGSSVIFDSISGCSVILSISKRQVLRKYIDWITKSNAP